MRSIRNQVQLIGNLGLDPEFKTLESGRAITKLKIATNDYYRNAQGEKEVDTQWHSIVAWGKVAENMEKILKKGHEVLVHGKLNYGSYQDKEGITRYTTDIVVSEFVKLTRDQSLPI